MSNADAIRAYLSKVDANDGAGARTHFAPDFEFVTPFGKITTAEDHEQLAQTFNAAFPGMAHIVDAAWELDDVVFIEGTWRGTQTGPMMLPTGDQLPPTGVTVEFGWAGIARLDAGLMTSVHVYFDVASFLGQLGLVPAAA